MTDSRVRSESPAVRAALALALLAACAGPKEAGPKQDAPKEPVASGPEKDGPTQTEAPADYSKLYWPQAKPFIDAPVVTVSPSGQRTVRSFEFPEGVRSAHQAAERAFTAKDCGEAVQRYNEVLAACPTCYPDLIGLGDCELRQGKARDAIDHYREAEQLNPDDFLGFFSEADAIARLGNLGEARELLTRALVLRPRRETVLKVLHVIEWRIGAIIDDEPLRPRAAFVRGNDLVVSTAEGDPAAIWWSIYAICKRIGTPEEIVREGKTLPAQRRWNSQQEEGCLRKTAMTYAEKRSAPGSDAALERFLTADAAGLAKGFVLYEIASRLDPQIVLEVPPDQRKLVDRYVRTIVVRDRGR